MSGEIEIYPCWEAEKSFAVLVWDKHRDSGFLAQTFASRELAIAFAQGMAEVSDLTFPRAQVIELSGAAA